jgi:hypothetical protein
MTVSGTTITIPVDLEPCQTVGFSITTTGHQVHGAAVIFRIFNKEGTPRVLDQFNWSSYGTVNQPELPTGAPWIYPYRGTRGDEGLPSYATLYATFFSSFGHTLAYSVTVTKSPRAGYNLGGTSFANASVINIDQPQYGSLHDWEFGQFYKITLEPTQTIYLSGEVTGSPTHGTLLKIELYDSSQSLIMTLVNKAAYGAVTFPTGGTYPTFTPPGGASSEYYLRATAQTWPAHNFQFQVSVLPCPVPVNFGLDLSLPPDLIHTAPPGMSELEFPKVIAHYAWASSSGNMQDLAQCNMREKVTRPPNYTTFPSPPFAANDTDVSPMYQNFPVGTVQAGEMSDVHTTAQPFVPPYSAIDIVTAQTYEYRCSCANSNNWVKLYEVFGGIKREFSQNPDGTWGHSITKHGYTARKSPLQ